MSADQQLANQYAGQASGIEGAINPIESQLAAGGGGYSPDEAQQIQLSGGDKSQIEYSPQDVNNIVNKAGISSGQATAAGVQGAEQAAAAAGGSPAALATYRARAAQTAGVNAGNAMTDARVAAKNAQSGAAATSAGLESAGGQAVGNARLNQQTQGLGYESGLQSEKNSNALSEQGLQQGAYGTQTSGTGQAAGLGFQASQTPTTTDKVIGGIAGAVSSLADGRVNYMDDGQDAVVGENGMEAVIENAPKAVVQGASNPVRSETKYMDLGDPGNGDYGGESSSPSSPWIGQSPTLPPAAGQMAGSTNGDYGGESGSPTSPGMPPAQKAPNFLQQYLAGMRNKQQQPGSGQQQQWNPTTPYQEAGSAIGKGLSLLEDGTPGIGNYMADGQPSTDQGVSMEADGQAPQTPEYYRHQADAALVRENKNEGPGKGGAQYSDHDVYTSMANTADVPANGWGSDMTGPGKAPLRSGPYTRQIPAGPGRGGQPHMADGRNGMQVGRAKVFTKPTMIHLEKTDAVVPLSYRPRAKVRPSAALPAMMPPQQTRAPQYV